jgi:hypothetical protein
MILGNPANVATAQPAGPAGVTIDDVFRRVALRRPNALALIDAPNRETFTDGAPRLLTYAEADRAVSAIAGRLRRMGLPVDTIVGIQLPNTVENVLTILGVIRAGMIAAPMPVLWRRADAVATLTRLGGKALITCGRVGSFDHCNFAMHVASEIFSIRYVCGFGQNLPDGVVPFDDLFAIEKPDPVPPRERERALNPAAHLAAITWDVGNDGMFPVARNHLELLAGGLAVVLESRIPQDGVIISGFAPSSFAGLCLGLLPWALSGATLALHHPFDAAVLARQRRERQATTLILPGSLVCRLAEPGPVSGDGLKTVIAAWRAPERIAASPVWRERDVALVDVPLFGEIGLLAARRGTNGRPAPIGFGPFVTPRGSEGAILVAELVRTEAGTVALRGPMVPHLAYPPGAERSGLPHLKVGRGAVVDTGYTCRVDSVTKAMVVTGPPTGIVSIGGYRFPLRELQDIVGRIDARSTLAALPDSLVGHRLIGNAPDRDSIQATLNELGLNPLVAAAFRDRRERPTPT